VKLYHQSRPIDELPFPSVTVCPFDVPIDQFALFRKMLNNLPFECSYSSDCDHEIRALVYPILNVILSQMKDGLMRKVKDLEEGEVFSFLSTFLQERFKGFGDVLKGGAYQNILVRLKMKGITENEIIEEVSANMGIYYSLEIDSLQFDEEEFEQANSTATLEEKKLAAVLTWMFFFSEHSMRSKYLGNFVAKALPKASPLMFGLNGIHRSREEWEQIRQEFPLAYYVHDLSSNMFRALTGYKGERNVSLMDLNFLLSNWQDRRVDGHSFSWTKEFMPYSILPQGPSKYSGGELKRLIDGQCNFFMGIFIKEYKPTACSRYAICCETQRLASHLSSMDYSPLFYIMSVLKGRMQEEETRFIYRANGTVYRDKSPDPDVMAPIGACNFGNKDELPATVTGCNMFKPVSTDNGICYAFNSDNVLRKSKFRALIDKTYEVEEDADEELRLGGVGKRLTLFMNRKTYPSQGLGIQASGAFSVAVNLHSKSFDFMQKQLVVEAGSHTIITVRPKMLRSQSNLKSLDVAQRGCLFPEEGNDMMKMLRNYSQEGCSFECMHAFAVEKCQCIPWDFPFLDDSTAPICDFLGYVCFKSALIDATHRSEACRHCLPDCDLTTFETEVHIKPVNFREICNPVQTWIDVYSYNYDPYIRDRLTGAFHWLTEDDYLEHYFLNPIEYCEHIIKDSALVTVQITQDYTLSKRAVRNSFSKKLALVGRTPAILS